MLFTPLYYSRLCLHDQYLISCFDFAGDQTWTECVLLVLLHWPGGLSPHGAKRGIKLQRGG